LAVLGVVDHMKFLEELNVDMELVLYIFNNYLSLECFLFREADFVLNIKKTLDRLEQIENKRKYI
jgi:hypothetical protein